MRLGKVSDSVLKRSVLKKIKTHREEVILGAALGEDCAFLQFEEGDVVGVTTDPVTCSKVGSGKAAVYNVTNDLAAGGAMPVAVLVSALFPKKTSEDKIKAHMEEIEEVCAALNIQLAGGHTEITDAVTRPVLTLTGIGKAKKDEITLTRGAKPFQDVVMTKWIGLEGTYLLAKERRSELVTRYPESMIDAAEEFERFLSVIPEAATAIKSGVSAMHDVSEGGVFSALWQLAESSGVGLEIDMKKIPVKQETIEICEFFGLNPYYFVSGGALLIVTDNGHDLVNELAKQEIFATVIGKTTDGNDRVVMNDYEKRFLEPSQSDGLHQMFE